MSRLVKSVFPTENTYVEFRFENSLRKYEPKLNKKVKSGEMCQQCLGHHLKRSCNMSPGRCGIGLGKGRTYGK